MSDIRTRMVEIWRNELLKEGAAPSRIVEAPDRRSPLSLCHARRDHEQMRSSVLWPLLCQHKPIFTGFARLEQRSAFARY
jgi:hypothetical protein